MSTRSIIAKQNENGIGFTGTYHHLDGYPTGVGQLIAKGFKQGSWKYVDYVLKHNWSNLAKRICYCCGTMPDGRHDPYTTHTNDVDSWAEWAYVFGQLESIYDGTTADWMAIYYYAPEPEAEKFDPNYWKLVSTIILEDELPDFSKLDNPKGVFFNN